MDAKRRRLIVGTVSVPLALTVRPGGATARSSAYLCMARDAQRALLSPKPAPLVPLDGDDWMRGSVELWELSIYKDGRWQKQSGQYFLGADNLTYWQVVADASGGETAIKSSFTKSNCQPGGTSVGRRHALVYVQDVGGQPTTVGYALETNGGGAVTGSCWTSVNPKV